MIHSPPAKKIVYLLGAGATHAEIVHLHPEDSLTETFLNDSGLLTHHVSKRVFRKANKIKSVNQDIKRLLSLRPLSNIELFISLIGDNRLRSEDITEKLKNLVQQDITNKLTKSRLRRFTLHKSLLELHSRTNNKEELLGFITLNYDDVLDYAWKTVFPEKEIDYSLSSKSTTDATPILKLHGGFSLKDRNKKIPIITPGINKNYLELPYNFIWGQALEILMECDILRVIGCSLSPYDIGLVDLLFKAHLSRTDAFEIELIDHDQIGRNIKETYGFFPQIRTAIEIEQRLIPDIGIEKDEQSNPFKIWLKAKTERMLTKEELDGTVHLKHLLV